MKLSGLGVVRHLRGHGANETLTHRRQVLNDAPTPPINLINELILPLFGCVTALYKTDPGSDLCANTKTSEDIRTDRTLGQNTIITKGGVFTAVCGEPSQINDCYLYRI